MSFFTPFLGVTGFFKYGHMLRMANRSTAKLEQKIESLVALLDNAQGVNINLDQLTPPESHSHSEPSPSVQPPSDVLAPSGASSSWTPSTCEQSASKPSENLALRLGEFPGTAVLPLDSSAATPTKEHFSSKIWQLSDHDGDRLLCNFREHFLSHFPFIIIPSKTQPELRTRNPYLLKAIWTIAFQENRARQINMSKDLMVDISTSMLVGGERDLDMLQSLILLNAWFVLLFSTGMVR